MEIKNSVISLPIFFQVLLKVLPTVVNTIRRASHGGHQMKTTWPKRC